jgi:hypothetical protein
VTEGRRRRRNGDRGFVAIELAAGVAVLVFPIALLVAALPGWFDRQSLARQAARDAARSVVLDGWCRPEVASVVAARIATGGGVDERELEVELACVAGTPLDRDRTVTARVSVEMPALSVPLVGSVGAWRWTATHSEPTDPYASRP